ncbi:MAG: PilZ domain-containing protein [Deltaproteobacteria bacterium]|nr:PilZ domain-containing protein [Deltaproteobacteria bacterium]
MFAASTAHSSAVALNNINKVDNRRLSARGPLYMLVEARAHKPAFWAFDVSLGGIRCISEKPIWPGTYLDLSFIIPDSREHIVTGGQIITLDINENDEVLIGIRFCCLASGASMAIYRFLDRRRRLWDPTLKDHEENVLATRFPHLAHIFTNKTPFANLLAETYETLGVAVPKHQILLS